MREGTAERFSCRKHRVPTRCVPDDLLCVFPKKKRKRQALRSRTMNPIGPFVISVVWSRGSRGGPSRTGCRCAAESCRDASRCFGRGGACVFSRRGSRGSPCPAFPCRDGGMPVEAESPSAGGKFPDFPFPDRLPKLKTRSAGSTLYFYVFCICVGKSVHRLVSCCRPNCPDSLLAFPRSVRMAFPECFYGEVAWNEKEENNGQNGKRPV